MKSQSTEKINEENSEMQQFNDHKAHYESLISLFKYAVGGMGTLLALTGAYIGYITYSDGKEMRAAMKDQQIVLQQNVAELHRKEYEMQKTLIDLIKTTREDVALTGQRAINQINDVKEESTNIARNEAKKRIEQVFDDNNVEDYIVQVAKERLEPQVQKLVDNKIVSIDQMKLEKALDDIASNDIIRHDLSYLYFQNTDPSTWTDEQLKHIINVLKQTDAVYVYDICMYLALTQSPIVDDYFRNQLMTKPQSHVGNFALNFLSRIDKNEKFEVFFDAFKAYSYESRPHYYFTLIERAAGNYNKKLVLTFLDNKELVDMVYVQLENLGMKTKIDEVQGMKNSVLSVSTALYSDSTFKAACDRTYFYIRPYNK